MGKRKETKKKGKGAEKTLTKTDKKLLTKQKKMLQKIGEEDIEAIVAKQEQSLQAISAAVEIYPSPPPSARVNFTVCTLNNDLVFFGGEFFNGQRTEVYGDLFFYNTCFQSQGDWKQIKAKGPTPRSGTQMIATETDGGQLWLFGGEYASPSQLQYLHFKDLWVFRMNSKQWDKVTAPGGPSARSGHRMVLNRKKLFIFGGFHDNNQTYHYFNDVHVFSLESYTWLTIELSGTVPAARSGCCMVAGQDGKILVWGGFCKSPIKKGVDKSVTHSDMFSLTVETDDTTETKYRWTLVKPGGSKPLPRSGMSVAMAPNGKAYVFGGVLDLAEDEDDLQGQFGNDFHVLDVVTQTWRRVELTKKHKKASGSTAAGSSTKNDMEVDTAPKTTVSSDGVFTMSVGGMNPVAASFLKPEFLKAEIQNPGCPAPRMNAGLAICKGLIYIYGGAYEEGSRQYTLSDFYSLDLHKLDSFKTIIANSTTQEWLGSDSEDGSDEEDELDDDDDDEESDSDDDDSSDMEAD